MSKSKSTDWKRYVGSRVIVQPDPRDDSRQDHYIREYLCCEVNREETLVKFKNSRGACWWSDYAEYELVSDLGPMEQKS